MTMKQANLFLTREFFDGFLEMELKRSLRYQNFTSLLLVQVKPENCQGGESLNRGFMDKMASLIRCELRETDVVGNYDGSVLSIILLYSDNLIAERVGERLKGSISSYFTGLGSSSEVGFSLGKACFPTDATDMQCLYKSAYSAILNGQTRLQTDNRNQQ
jgi:diguanylate cyclase (GGDEF)-like protein